MMPTQITTSPSEAATKPKAPMKRCRFSPSVTTCEIPPSTGSDKVQQRKVELGATTGTLRVVTSGLAPGERVVVDGLQKVSDGSQVVVASRWSVQRDQQGRPIGTLETNTDITERKQAEEYLQRQATLLDQTHDAIIVWKFPGEIIYWNRGAERLYGYTAEEATGRSSHELLRTEHPMPAELFETTIERRRKRANQCRWRALSRSIPCVSALPVWSRPIGRSRP